MPAGRIAGLGATRDFHHGLLGVALVAALACLTAAPRVRAQQQGQLYISVLDADNKPVTDLEPGDLTVVVDDVDCKVVKLEPVTKPMKLTLMVDNGPVLTKELATFRTALKGFFDALPADLEISLYTINPQPRTIVKSTTDRKALLKGVDLIAPDTGAGMFFDALVEASDRVEKDKSDHFPVLMMVASDFGRNSSAMDRDFERLQRRIVQKAITVHFLILHGGGDRVNSVAGALQTEVGLQVTKLSGGRYENIAAATRLVTLLPEFAKQIAESNLRQTHQYRITYERQDSRAPQRLSASLSRLRIGVQAKLSVDGHMP
ncbi:MAG: hypothetical protein ABJA98_27640 [Acidobacteriota bacterium]